MGASKIGKSDRQQCTIKVLYASSGTRQLFLFSLCVVLVMLLCWFESNLFLVVKFEINTLQVECFEDRPMVYSPNHPFPRYIYIYRMLVSTCPMNSSSLHNMDVMILLFVTDDDDNGKRQALRQPSSVQAFLVNIWHPWVRKHHTFWAMPCS